ncbi:hypothetical protein LDENG_00294560 [Lucifuga dentata]|nr:hypothetical protein LDENG_00294560 [Lucifuga dentata]
MDSEVSQNQAPLPMRRSTRQSSANMLRLEPTPRGPLKRTKKRGEKQVTAVNGSRDEGIASEDEETPSKKNRLDTAEVVGDSGDALAMDVQGSNEILEKNKDQERISLKESTQSAHQPKFCPEPFRDVNLAPRVVLERCRPIFVENKDTDSITIERVKLSTKEPAATTKSSPQLRLENRHDVQISRSSSMAAYKERMEEKAKSAGAPKVNHDARRVYPTSELPYTTRQHVHNIPAQTQSVQHRKQEKKGKEKGQKSAATKKRSGHSCSGFIWYSWLLGLLVLLSSAALHVYKNPSVIFGTADIGDFPSQPVEPGMFAAHFSDLETQFPSQHPELWRRSKIHLERHLLTAQPTEPVSLMLTAGRRAERTLWCLAQSLASAFSSALNASVLHINGSSKASQDSNQVKLDIDNQLRAAFEGDKPAAVIHHLEELPPGSTLIFYRYCDHENAAYKQVFLTFTVLLPQDELRAELSLKDVEEMVQDYVKERLVGSNKQTAFNRMDIDKFGGLWSRISHLILPVVSETTVEQIGC